MEDKTEMKNSEEEKRYLKNKTSWGGRCKDGYITYELANGEKFRLSLNI